MSEERTQFEESPGLRSLAAGLRLVFRLLIVAVALMVAGSVFRLYVVVKQHQIGVVFRFGRIARVLGPGQRAFILPPPLGDFKAYTATREQSIQSDAFLFARTEAERQTGQPGAVPPTLRPELDGYLVGGDRNIVHCVATLYFGVNDPVKYYLMTADEPRVLESLLNHALVSTAASYDIETMLIGVGQFAEESRLRLIENAEAVGLGIQINRLVVRPLTPRQVKEAFDRHTAVSQQVDQMVKEAQAYSERVRNEAVGRAARTVSLAEAERARRIAGAQARTERYRQIMEQYGGDVELIARELYTESVRRVLAAADEQYLVDPRAGRELRITLDRPAASTSGQTETKKSNE